MKIIIIIFLSLFLILIVSANPLLEFQNEQIQSGETIIATITTVGEFVKQIEEKDISFYEGRKQISFESDIIFYNNIHYLYIYITREGNFSIQIENVLYEEDELKSLTIIKPFSVSNEIIINETNESSKKILSIKPGFIFTAETPIIKLINKGTIALNITYSGNELSLEPLETREIILNPIQVFSYFNISSYKEFSVPIIYLSAENTTFESPIKKIDLKLDTELIFAELFVKNESEKTMQLFNFGDENITNIKISSDVSFIEIEQLENMSPRGIQNLTLIFNPKNSGHFQGYVNITYIQYGEENILSIPLSLFVLPKGSGVEDFEISEKTCEEISGIVCTIEESCDGKATFTKNAEYCCSGKCLPITEDKSNNGGFGWLIGLIIFAILGIGGYYLYKKQKNISPKSPEEKMKETSKKFNKRMMGSPNRISGELTKS